MAMQGTCIGRKRPYWAKQGTTSLRQKVGALDLPALVYERTRLGYLQYNAIPTDRVQPSRFQPGCLHRRSECHRVEQSFASGFRGAPRAPENANCQPAMKVLAERQNRR